MPKEEKAYIDKLEEKFETTRKIAKETHEDILSDYASSKSNDKDEVD